MDEGADLSWKERFNHDELSAIQHATNLKLQDEAALFAEYQNEPLPEETVDDGQLTADQVAAMSSAATGDVTAPSQHTRPVTTATPVARVQFKERRCVAIQYQSLIVIMPKSPSRG